MKNLWLIQTSGFITNYINQTIETLNDLNYEFKDFGVIPYNNKVSNLNNILREDTQYKVENGDTNFLCNISGVCEVNKEDQDSQVGSCYFCGTELIKHSNGNWYHYSAFDDNGILENEYYQTHNNYGAAYPDHTSEEERTLYELKEKLKRILLECLPTKQFKF